MNCTACGKANLPGGVRCSYCGVAFPAGPGFDLGAAEATPAPETPIDTGKSGDLKSRAAGGLTALLLLLFKGKTFLSLLSLGKIATTLGSMFVFIAAEAAFFGWRLGVGIAVCILIHELGHVFVNWHKGLAQSAPMFIPFAGAVIFLKQFPNNPQIQSESGAGGPIAGGLAAFACLAIFAITGDPFWKTLAFLGFLINLFNLAPFPPLDGSHIVTVFSPAIWSAVLVGMLLYVLKVPMSPLWMVLIVGFVFRLGHPDHGRHLLAPPIVRARMAVIYLLVCVALSWGIQKTLPAARSHAAPGAAANAPASPAASGTATPPVARGKVVRSPIPERPTLSPLEYVLAFAVVGGVAFSFWSWAAALLAGASRAPWRRYAGLPVAMTVLALVLLALSLEDGLPVFVKRQLFFGWLAATAGGFVYAAYARLRPLVGAAGPTALAARCLAWSAGGALALAYARDYLWLAGAVALATLVVWAVRPYLPLSLAASLAESMGDLDRAVTLWRRAVDRGAPADTGLLMRIAQSELLRERGKAALTALDELARVSPETAGGIAYQEARVAALTLLGRIDEALSGCETLLQATPGDRTGPYRLLAVHMRLARLAGVRGWWDEALAQITWCRGAAPREIPRLTAYLSATEASIRAEMGDAVGARVAADRALAASREPGVIAAAATARTAVALAEGDAQAAQKEIEPAVRALPGNLSVRYWQGRVARAAAADSGELSELATRHPAEYWGARSRHELAAV